MRVSKMLLALVLVFALTASLAACSSAPEQQDAKVSEAPKNTEAPKKTDGEDAVFESDGMKLTVPAKYAELVTVETDQDDLLFSVTEKASAEASEYEGAGWLFGIARIDEARLHEMMTSDMSGADVFARDGEGNYYLFCHPTDVRIEREGEITEEDMQQWGALTEWANDAKAAFIADNAGLESYVRTNTDVDISLSKIAYQDDVAYTISTTEFGPKEPGSVDKTPFVTKLLDGVVFEYADTEAPDGEYVVLAFKDGDMDVRIDFFSADGNLIRVTRSFTDGAETIENETFYTAHYADGTTVAGDVMQSWYDALVAAGN